MLHPYLRCSDSKYRDNRKGLLGDELAKVFNDWEGVNELTSQPSNAEHQAVDRVMLDASKSYPDKIKTTIVCPPVVYGQGRGPDNQRSKQIYRAAESFIKTRKAFMVGKGFNVWHQVHVRDLSKLYLRLGDAALREDSPATWNEQGYYLAENGAFVWRDILQALALELSARNLIDSTKLEELSSDEANKLFPFARFVIGTNSGSISIRGKKLLGWALTENSLLEEIPMVVQSEALQLGLMEDCRNSIT